MGSCRLRALHAQLMHACAAPSTTSREQELLSLCMPALHQESHPESRSCSAYACLHCTNNHIQRAGAAQLMHACTAPSTTSREQELLSLCMPALHQAPHPESRSCSAYACLCCTKHHIQRAGASQLMHACAAPSTTSREQELLSLCIPALHQAPHAVSRSCLFV